MVGVTALISMSQHDLGLKLPHYCQYSLCYFLQLE